jgi:hypothetical protein
MLFLPACPNWITTMPSTEPECVFQLGVEGGGVDFFRQWNADGTWQFTHESSNGGFDRAEFDEGWVPPPPAPPVFFATIEDAIAHASPSGEWTNFTPVEVHPDFMRQVWQMREKTIASFSSGKPGKARPGDVQWRKLCGQERRHRQPDASLFGDRPRSPSTPVPELILELGAEGGGVDFFRQLGGDGLWRFAFKCLGGGFDESDFSEDWTQAVPKPSEVYLTIDDAIGKFSTNGNWILWTPTEVHADFKRHVWKLREKTIKACDERTAGFARARDHVWARKCDQKTPASALKKAGKPRPIIVRPGGTLDMVLGVSIAIFEHLRKEPMSTEETAEFEATVIKVLEMRQNERSSAMRSTRSRGNLDAQE